MRDLFSVAVPSLMPPSIIVMRCHHRNASQLPPSSSPSLRRRLTPPPTFAPGVVPAVKISPSSLLLHCHVRTVASLHIHLVANFRCSLGICAWVYRQELGTPVSDSSTRTRESHATIQLLLAKMRRNLDEGLVGFTGRCGRQLFLARSKRQCHAKHVEVERGDLWQNFGDASILLNGN